MAPLAAGRSIVAVQNPTTSGADDVTAPQMVLDGADAVADALSHLADIQLAWNTAQM
jgi:hypothetical protein